MGSRKRRQRSAGLALVVLGVAQVASTIAYLSVRGAPRLVEGVALAIGNVYPFVCAALAQRPGAYVAATRIALAFAVSVTTTLSLVTGGLSSPFVLILVTVPSADFSASGPRGVLMLGGLSFLAAIAIAVVDRQGWLDHLALPDDVQGAATTVFLLHCVIVMVAVNLGLASARARATRELSEARDQALAANRTKSSFLAIMSHELRTPLTGLTGTLDLLADSDSAEQSQDYIRVAQNSARSLRTLLDDVLDFSKIEAGSLEVHAVPTRPDEILQGVAALFAVAAAGRHVELRVDIDPACDSLTLLDGLRLRQIVSNLVGNALKFTDRGHVELRARIEPGPPRRLVVVVSDTGIGIPEARLAELFQPFVQVHRPDRSAGGTGLGLVISRRLAEAMGGSLAVTSAVGVGSAFTVDVPAPEVEATATIPESAAPEPVLSPPTEPLRILVAEDSPAVHFVIRQLLVRRGHTVTMVDDGQKAVERASVEDYDLIFMDMQMPICDGLSATRAIRELPSPRGEVRIVALSADAFNESRSRAIAAGCDDYLTKPINVASLSAALAMATQLRDARRGETGA